MLMAHSEKSPEPVGYSPACRPARDDRRIENVDLKNRVRVLPGETRTVDVADNVLMTVLGSCVSACIRNPVNGFGGMNHFMLPSSECGTWNGEDAALRYGNFAMEALINEVLKSGCRREDLEIKVFGEGQTWAFIRPGSVRRMRISSCTTWRRKACVSVPSIWAVTMGAACFTGPPVGSFASSTFAWVRTGRSSVRN